MLLRFYPFVVIWRFYMMMYIDLMTCIFWRCMTYIRCDCWEILYTHVVWILMWRRSVYFLNIYIIRVYYRFNRNRVLQRSWWTQQHSEVFQFTQNFKWKLLGLRIHGTRSLVTLQRLQRLKNSINRDQDLSIIHTFAKHTSKEHKSVWSFSKNIDLTKISRSL